MLKGQNILSSQQFDRETLLGVCGTAAEMEKILESGKQSDLLAGKVMATLFYEPSTRTRFSFETAMNRLGGRVVSNADMMSTSSAKKSETLWDTGKVVSQMVDVIAMRHPEKGAVAELAEGSDVPVLNAGDGPGDHPTQALLDMYSIMKYKGTIDGLTVGIIGDLKHSRVLRAQCQMLSGFDVKLVLISPQELALDEDVKSGLKNFEEVESIADVIVDLDVISVNRIQEERFPTQEEADKHRGKFVITSELMKSAKEDAVILCPLPRMEELPKEIDDDPRAKYFDQVHNGVAARMALLAHVFGIN